MRHKIGEKLFDCLIWFLETANRIHKTIDWRARQIDEPRQTAANEEG